MQTNFTLLRHLLVAGFFALALAACTPQERAPLPAPTAPLSVAAARAWYQATYAPAKTASATAAAPGDSAATWALDWARAIPVAGTQPLVLVPLAGDAHRFAGRRVQGRRYLVVAQAPTTTAPTGQLVELLLQPSAAPLDTAALVAGLFCSYAAGTPPAAAPGTGLVLFYSADYRYLAGRRFAQGGWQPGTVHLALLARGATSAAKQSSAAAQASSPQGPTSSYDSAICTDWYQVMADGTRTYITTTGDCYENMPTVGDGGYGGGGGGGGGTYGGTGDSDGGNGGWGGSGHGNGPTGNNNVQSFILSPVLIPCAKKLLLM